MQRLYIYLIVAIQIEWIFGIRCYSCVGQLTNKRKSEDPCFNPAQNVGDGNVHEIDCTDSKLCWKGITGGRLKRGCGEKRCAFIPDINIGSILSQTCCSNDLCNRTSSTIVSQWIVYSLIVFLSLFRLHY